MTSCTLSARDCLEAATRKLAPRLTADEGLGNLLGPPQTIAGWRQRFYGGSKGSDSRDRPPRASIFCATCLADEGVALDAE